MNKAIQNHINKLNTIISLLETFNRKKNKPKTINQTLNEKFGTNDVGQRYIYIIESDNYDKKKIVELFNAFRETNKEDYKLSSLNEFNNFNGVLYVGSSLNIDSRINQHLGHTGKKVYSLQLNQWGCSIMEHVTIKLYKISDHYTEILYPLENALWDYYLPLFGKKGTNVNSSKFI